eukprot:TRINITY_DN9723_c0_g1_i1.p1 TRINITY_DN9723_c0_g1~~TRINITY_DN9723_c0_g1_i1.p1  ORF type:complete len:393 (-),score=148.12 TRINITY_DN9723_c0_g1_i1:85-1263(-)
MSDDSDYEDAQLEQEEEDENLDLSRPEVVDKYRAASEIANAVMLQVLAACTPERRVVEVCALGDKLIDEALSKTWTKFKRGIAFPTCVSVNNCVGHYSPYDNDTLVIKTGDVVKVDLGVHIDGFISQCAHTVVAGQTPENVLTGRPADVICAAYFALESALRLIRPGKTNQDVSAIIQKVAEVFNCKPVEGVLSHQMKRYIIDANKVILNKPDLENQVDTVNFEENEVYGLDIVMSTGEGKAREGEARTTVYKRAIDQTYGLKMKSSRALLSEANKRFATLPFTLRAFDAKTARPGITELVKHDMVHAYPVLFEKAGEFVAHFKCTVLVLPNSTMKLNEFPLPYVSSSFSIDNNEEIKTVMAMSLKRNKKKKKAKAKKAAQEGAKSETMDTS